MQQDKPLGVLRYPFKGISESGNVVVAMAFIVLLADLDCLTMARVLREQAGALRRPPQSPFELLETLRRQGLDRAAVKLRQFLLANDLETSETVLVREPLQDEATWKAGHGS